MLRRAEHSRIQYSAAKRNLRSAKAFEYYQRNCILIRSHFKMCDKYKICLLVLHLIAVAFAFPAKPRSDQLQHEVPEPNSSNFNEENVLVSRVLRSLFGQSFEEDDEEDTKMSGELAAFRESDTGDESYEDFADYGNEAYQSNSANEDLQSDNTATLNSDENDLYLYRWMHGGLEGDGNDDYNDNFEY